MQTAYQFRWPRLTPAVRIIVIVLAVAFVSEVVLTKVVGLDVFGWLALHPTVGLNWVWQPFTFVLVEPLESSVVVLLFCVGLLFTYLILAPFEERFGSKRVWQMVAVAILCASIPPMLLGLILHAGPHAVFGAHCLMWTGIAAFATLFRGQTISIFGVLPMKSWHVISLEVLLSALMAMINQDPFYFAAAMGAIGGGIAFARWISRPRPKPKATRKRQSGPALKLVRGGEDDEGPRWLN